MIETFSRQKMKNWLILFLFHIEKRYVDSMAMGTLGNVKVLIVKVGS